MGRYSQYCAATISVIVCFLMFVFIYESHKTVEWRSANQLIPSCSQTSTGGIDWGDVDVGRMTGDQIMNYFSWSNRSSCRLSHDFGGKVIGLPSGVDGQKAICLDKAVAPDGDYNCTVYSFGINNEWSFDESMEQYGCQVFSFDPSMNMTDHSRTDRIHFFNLGLFHRDEDRGKNGWKLRTLSSVYQMLKSRHGDVPIDYLKIDIELDEWEVIPQIIKSGMLDKVRQIGVEMHLFPPSVTIERLRHFVRVARALERSGMVRFDSKYNPWSLRHFDALGSDEYMCYEIAWYNSRLV